MAKKKRIDGGRPTVMTESTLAVLKEAFAIGATNAEACSSACISVSTFYDYTRDNPLFSDDIHLLKQELPLRAKKELSTHIKAGDRQTVQWYLERKRKDEFSLKTEVETNQKIEISNEDRLKELPPEDLKLIHEIFERNSSK